MSPKTGVHQPSLRQGYWFYFNDEGTPITVFGSSYSGKEVVFVGEEIVSSKRNLLRRSGRHPFHIGATPYEVELALTEIMTGKLECRLFKNGEQIACETKAYIDSARRSWKSYFKELFWLFVFGGLVGFLIAYVLGHHLGRYLATQA